jgi:GNAT superfamily N-acetyltransferase
MNIRAAEPTDIPAIIRLLKSSLGETSSPKTPAYWQWKHLDNPFGASPVWISEEDEELTGVRAFMRWQWQHGEKVFEAIRAVDTATHPASQGKGIFKKLTLGLAEACMADGLDFIFNTPNEQSLPGYLKMGWVQAGRLPVTLALYPGGLLLGDKKLSFTEINWEGDDLESLCDATNRLHTVMGTWFTPKSPAYLRWRYQNNPVIDYTCLSNRDFFAAAYTKKRGKIKELRVSELLVRPGKPEGKSEATRQIRQLARSVKAPVISVSPVASRGLDMTWDITKPIGPVLTLRKLAMDEEHWASLPSILNGAYQIGDLELF